MTGSREYPSAPIVGVGAVVLDADRVLLVRRNRPPLLGQWSIPGGAVELGETLEQAVVREVAEETGLAVVSVEILKTFERIDRDDEGRVRYHYVLVDFLCRALETPGALCAASDVSDACWAETGRLRQNIDFVLPDWTLEVIEEGLRRARENSGGTI